MKRVLAAVTAALLMSIVSAHANNGPYKAFLLKDCGKETTLATGSTPYAGSVTFGAHIPPGNAHLKSCTVEFAPTPFNGGTKPYFIAPQCTVTGTTERVLYSISITAAGIRLTFDDFLPPPSGFQWTCAYPK